MSENDPEFHKFRAQLDREGSRGERQKDLTPQYVENAEKIWGKREIKTLTPEEREELTGSREPKKRLTLNGI